MKVVWLTILVGSFATLTSADELLKPIAIEVDSEPLDVEHMGYAAPFAVDFDNDGNKDLLVGEYYKGRLRIYRNVGTNRQPRFVGYSLFKNGDPSGCIHASCCMGFAPQVIDFDGDGHRDVLSGNWIFQAILFRGQPDGSFSAGAPVERRGGQPLRIGYGVATFAVDWDSDGDMDLLAGTVDHVVEEGNVFLIQNNGSVSDPDFGEPEHLMAGDKPIFATDGGAAPVAADWDGDGKLDLILGCGDGSVRWYRNQGTTHQPQLAAFELLVDAPRAGDTRGKRAKPCVIDWNEDGQLDLLVGDVGEHFEKQLTPEEIEWRKSAADDQAAILTQWSRVFSLYRKLAANSGDADGSEDAELEKKIALTRGELVRLSTLRRRMVDLEDSLQSGKQTHGRVWLYLRRGQDL